MEYQAPSVSFTRNELSNSHSFSAKSMYDGVFGAPSKFGVPTFSARVDEYRDIFTGSEASGGSSIPILDIPELNERKISVDDRSSKVDYTDIFGGFADSDFAEPYEQIFVDPKKNENVPEEASGKPTEKVSTSEVFGTYSEGNHGFPLETYEKPLNDIKKFNMSYHRVNNRKNDGTNGTTHVAQLHAVPGYTCVFDEVAPLPVNKGNKFVSSDVNDSCPSNNLREEVVIGNHIRKTMADFPTSVTSNGTSVKLFDTHENAHGTHHPEVSTPSSLDNNSGSSEQPMTSRFWKTNTDTFEGSNIYCSPSFDEEVDKNSFAATSVAALRKAIEEAQARIKIAKELKGRKTVGLQHRVKLSFKGGIKDDEEKNGQFVDEVNISRIKKAHESHEEMDALSHTSAGMTNHNLIGPDQVTLGIKPQEKISHAKEVEREILGKNFISVRMDHRQEEAEISEAEEQFFEVYNTGEEWATEFKEAKNENRMTQSVGEHKQMEKGTLNETYEKPEQDAEKLKPAVAELAEVEQFFEVSDTGEDWPATFEFKEAENANNLISEDKLEENRNMDEISKKPKQRDGELKPVEVDGYSEGTERKIRVCDETRVPLNYEEQSSKLRSDVHIINLEIVDSRIQVAQVHEETEKIEPVHGRDKYEEKSRDMQEPMKHDERLGTQRMEELEFSMRQSAVLTSVEKEKEVEEACKLEGYKKEQNDAHWVENVENNFEKGSRPETIENNFEKGSRPETIENNFEKGSRPETIENNFEKGSRPETIEATLYDINSAGETEKIPGDDSALEENEKLHEDVSEEKMFMVDDYQTKDYHKIQEKTGQWVEDGMMETNIVVSAGCEETIKENREDLLDQNGLEATEDLYGQYESDSLNIIPKSIVIGFHGSMDSSPEVPACEETKYIKEGSKSSLELEEKGMELEPVEENNEVEEREILETDGLPQGFKLSEILKQMEDTMGPSFWGIPGMNLGGADVNYVENLKYKHAWEFETVCSSGNGREESAPELEVKGVIKENEEDVGFDVKAHHLSDVSERKGENLGLEQPMEAGTSTEKYREEEEEIPISQSAENNEESQQETDSSPSSENNEESQQETDSSPSSENNEDEFDKMLTSQVMETSEEYHQESLASQIAKPAEEIYQTTLIAEEIECNDSFQKESELEKEEPQRKTDEKNERERDKEKEKKAVERAIREARERAFSEARERAAVERAAAKSHQRERLGKTSIESNNKSLSEKASKEAKLKAERAAVERVLAEARERALEKAMSFKSSTRATKHAERFVDEKKSGAFRDTGIKRSASSVDPQDKGSCSSNHNERFDGANGESAPRCKARFERQQRTAERAAKALAEKNMRDLLVQREQAERNRLAEIIDAEVKRWSSGKEGNIRALLSTLQYILGPGSGWQPIPLTDVITTVAVKKAYRRATLSVHPDKLQQRGASIQQKYTCEKVFDLLKDAWNRFNVEER